MEELFGLLSQIPASLDAYNDQLVCRDTETIRVKFVDIGKEVEQKLC